MMKKLSIFLMAVLVALLAGCGGTEVTNDLPVVQDLQLDATSTGRTIVLVWSAVDDVDGYKIYFKTDGAGDWISAGEVTGTTYTHNAVNAGTYSIRAYKGDNHSAEYSATVSTMPMVIDVSYSIYDNYSAGDKPSGFIFGPDSGATGMASSADFLQDIYAYDESKGDEDVWLYSGNFGTFGNGRQSYFQTPASGVYGNCDPDGQWITNSYELYTTDSVVFVELPYQSGTTSAYAKMYGLTVTADETENGTVVTFMYEYQSNTLGLTLFTSNAI
ncbi:MAG: fibronectin type III domain-containing protein [Candidatus Sabulitectum sp.]|nr:fibronectin type III domain-containing protein [Candidatus Sabulitectum sp.]